MDILVLSILAGVVGMGLGSIITAIFGSKTDKMVSIFLSLAGGVMISIVLIELIPEAIEYSNTLITVIGVVLGVLMVMLLNNVMDRVTSSKKQHSTVHDSYTEFFHTEGLTSKKKGMLRSGMIMLFAIALHNIPEGLAMGAAGYVDISLGVTIAIMIGLHNIPEGMAIAAPLISGGVSKTKTILLVTITGATTVIGAIVGMLVGGISEIALALSFALASGAMLYVVFGEILPQALVSTKDKTPAIFALVGIVVGIIFTMI